MPSSDKYDYRSPKRKNSIPPRIVVTNEAGFKSKPKACRSLVSVFNRMAKQNQENVDGTKHSDLVVRFGLLSMKEKRQALPQSKLVCSYSKIMRGL